MGNYSVVVTNACGAVSSSNALLSLWPLLGWGQDFYAQADPPAGLSNVVGVACGLQHSLALGADGTVVAWGTGRTNLGVSPDYGQSIVPGGLSNVVGIAAGYYHSLAVKGDGNLVAWGYNPYGQASIPAGLSNVVSVAGGYNHTLVLQRDGTVAAWGYGNFGQTNVPAGLSNVIAIAAGAYHSVALKADGTVSAWGAGTYVGSPPQYGQSMVPAGLSNVVAIASRTYHNLALKADGTVVAWGAGTYVGSPPQYGQSMVPAGLSNVVAVAAGFGHSMVLRADGTLLGWGSNTYGQTNVPGALSNVVAVAGGGYHNLAMEGDGRPRITIQPVSQSAPAGANVTLAAMAVGQLPVTYQWQCNGTNVDGATNNLLTLTNVQYASGGYYTVTAANSLGTNPSSSAALLVLSPPVISLQPASQAVLVGATASFAVGAFGTLPLDYRWRFNGFDLPGATQSSYTIVSAQTTNAGDYCVSVSNRFGMTLSSNATLSVLVPPSITAQPTNLTVFAGASATFQLVATGSPPLSYQWFFNETNPLGWAAANALVLTNVRFADAGLYSALVTNVAGSATSTLAALTVLAPPGLLNMPQYFPPGVFEVSVAGMFGSNYVVEASTNLLDWVPLETNTSPFTFTDTNALNLPLRFYRAR
jgi:alpha-tubulin suppressor-like RCC1 family protein